MKEFWELFKESVILQAVITVILIGGVVYMYATGQEVPKELLGMTTTVLGFYFGAKVENRKVSGAVKRIAQEETKRHLGA